ncbi:fasciclin-like arabinogalactan protein 13 [Typha latifolia]|uniref:fasciclin-like arabinogalactan protein 13 n=1 Tax=Typha latifolia TaxID=4733 RepID=UPI003C2E768F
MASLQTPSSLLSLLLIQFLLLLTNQLHLTHAATDAAAAPGPTPAPLNLTGILVKGSQYSTFLRLLKETQVGEQIIKELDDTVEGFTILAPTDNAFSNLKTGTLNKLSMQDQSGLVLYHVLPKYYSFVTFETTSNPVRTQASSNNGVYTVNVTSARNQVNVSTGVVDTSITNALYSEFPLAVYSLDKVLLPYDLFGPKSAVSKPKGTPDNSTSTAAGPSSEAVNSSSSAVVFTGRNLVWVSLVGFAVLMGLVI